MWWVIFWILMLVGSGAYLGVLSWGLWGHTKELGSEIATAQRGLDEVQGQLELLGEQIRTVEDLAVFTDPAAARRERVRARAERRRLRRQRLAISRPAWAKHVD